MPDGTIRPAHQILVYADAGLNESTLVTDDLVDLEGTSVTITAGLINAVADQLNFNEDDPSAVREPSMFWQMIPATTAARSASFR